MQTKSFRELLASTALVGATALVTVTLVSAPQAFAQDYTSGALTGNVADADGNAVGGATITLRSQAQGFERTASSSSDGKFRFSSLPQGIYEVSVTAAGYDSFEGSAVNVTASSTADFTFTLFEPGSRQQTVTVTGIQQNIAFSDTTQGLNLNVADIAAEIPIGRSLTAVTLLAPNTQQGDGTFGNLAAIGGSSVAENAYYLNGLNLTNFDNYLGSSVVPFEFYESVEVKTAAYPAEYGRSTGGILNAVSKSGTNEFTGALRVNWSPDELSSQSPDTFASRNSLDYSESLSAIVEVGGPIIKDRLFFYGLAEFRDTESRNAGILSGVQTIDTADDPFYGFKLDGFITDDHQLEFTYINTERETLRETRAFDSDTNEFGAAGGSTLFQNGGESWVGKYTGTITPWLTISAAYGENNDKNVTLPGSSEPYVVDVRSGIGGQLRTDQTATSTTFPRETKREFFRFDVDTYFQFIGDHHVRFGFEQEDLFFARSTVRTGPDEVAYIYRTAVASDNRAQGAGGVPVGSEYVEVNLFSSGGEFESQNKAYYVQDQWDVNDQLTLSLGLRLDQFANFTANGSQFVDFDNEIAPRLGISYDPFGEGDTRFYANFGVYYLPVASNTAFRQGSQEFYFREYWTFTNDPTQNGVPVLGNQILNFQGANPCPFGIFGPDGAVGCVVTGDGSVQDPTASISQNLEATEQQEFVLGMEQQINDDWSVNVSYVYRELTKTAEDVAVDSAVNAYCQANGIEGCSAIWNGFHQYTIINPGSNSTITLNDLLPGETEIRTIDFTAEQLGYPEAERTYEALEISFERAFSDGWNLRGSYVLSESRGNTEGYVKSDNGQTDAGITQDFDTPNLTDGANGLLPNHRAHAFKLFGSYQVTDRFLIGANASLTSPRKFGCIGVHPERYNPPSQIDPADLYGAASNYCGGDLVPRGTAFESDWSKNVDVSLRYDLPVSDFLNVRLRADIFNIFGFESKLDFDEFGEEDNGDVNPFYKQVTAYQSPRGVRLGFDITF